MCNTILLHSVSQNSRSPEAYPGLHQLKGIGDLKQGHITKMKNLLEHVRAVAKHWVWLMSGVVSIALTLIDRFFNLGIPAWLFLAISGLSFFVAFHIAWLDKDRERLAALGPAPEIVLEYECGEGAPLKLRNLRGWTAYHVKIEDVIVSQEGEGTANIDPRCVAVFEEVSHLPEGESIQLTPTVTDCFIKTESKEWSAIKNDFAHVLECAYQTYGHDFDPIQIQVFVRYSDRAGRNYLTRSDIVFDRFKTTAKVTCEPPIPVIESKA